jgi:hypothetical protein
VYLLMQGRKPLLSLVYTLTIGDINSLLFNLEVSSIHCLIDDEELDEAELGSEDDDGDTYASVDALLDSSDDTGVVSAEESEVGAGEDDSDSDPGEEVSTEVEDAAEDPSTELVTADEELSHPPQIVSPGIHTVEMVVETIVLVAKLVLNVPVAVDKTGLMTHDTQSEGRPDGT